MADIEGEEDAAGPQFDASGNVRYVLDEKRVNFTYNLLQYANMPEDQINDAMDVTTTAIEKFGMDYGIAAKEVKEHMDKKYQPSWNVVIGESYGFKIQYEMKYMLYFYSAGITACLIYKC